MIDPGAANFCLDNTETITASSDDFAATYEWYIEDPSGNEAVLPDPNSVFIDLTFDMTGDYFIFLEVFDDNGCNNNESITATIALAPTAGFTISEPTPCEGTDVILDAAPTTGTDAGAIYDWEITNTSTSTTSNDVGANLTLSSLTPGMYDITLTVTNSTSCSHDLTQQFEVTAAPPIIINAIATDIFECDAPFDYSLAIDSPTGGTWSGMGVDAAGIFDPSGLAGGGPYTITYSVGTTPCISTEDLIINVLAPPTVSLTETTLSICDSAMPDLNNYIAPGSAEGTWSGMGVDANGMFDPTGLTGDVVLTFTASCMITLGGNICPPIVAPVCGCDGTTYNNSCEAFEVGGVTTYSLGACIGGVPDASACNHAEATITISITAATSELAPDPTVCSSDAPINLDDYVTTGTGTWEDGSGATVTSFDPSSGPFDTPIPFTFMETGSCGLTSPFNITVTETPDASTLPINEYLCNTLATNGNIFIDLDFYITGELEGVWTCDDCPSGSTPIDAGNEFDATDITPGTYTLTYTVTGTAPCTQATSQQILTITEPTAEAGPDDSTCGLTYTLQGISSGDGIWDTDVAPTSGTAAFVDTADPVTEVTVTEYGTYTFFWTSIDDPCNQEIFVDITFEETQDLTLTQNTLDLCTGDAPITLTDYEATGTGAWTNEGGSTITDFDPSTVSGSATVDLMFSSGMGPCDNSETLSITVMTQNDITLNTSTDNICSNAGTITLDDYIDTGSGIWTDSNGSSATTFDPTFVADGTTTDFTISTGTGACDSDATINITVTTAPNASIDAPPGNLCNNDVQDNVFTIDLTTLVTGNAGGTWSTNAPNNPIDVNNVFDAQGLPEGNFTITYSVVGTSPCMEAVMTQNITIVNCPANCTEDATTIAPESLCNQVGSTLDLTTLVIGNLGGTWSTNAPGSPIDLSSVFDANGLAAGNYTLTYTIAGATDCPDAVSNQTINIIAAPNASINAPPGNLCNNDVQDNVFTIDLTTLVTGNAGGTWSTNAPNNPIDVNNVFDAQGLPEGNFTITYSVVGTSPCMEAVMTQNITIVNCPANCTEDATTIAPESLCNQVGSTLDLTTLVIGNLGGTWSTNAPGSPIDLSSVFDANGLAAGNYTLTYTITGATDCPDAVSNQTIIIEEASNCNTANCPLTLTPNHTICNTQSTTLTTTGGTSQIWSTEEITPSITVTPSTTTTYYVTITNSTLSCEVQDSVTITVENQLLVDAENICIESDTLTGNFIQLTINGGTGGNYEINYPIISGSLLGEPPYTVMLADSITATDTIDFANNSVANIQVTSDLVACQNEASIPIETSCSTLDCFANFGSFFPDCITGTFADFYNTGFYFNAYQTYLLYNIESELIVATAVDGYFNTPPDGEYEVWGINYCANITLPNTLTDIQDLAEGNADMALEGYYSFTVPYHINPTITPPSTICTGETASINVSHNMDFPPYTYAWDVGEFMTETITVNPSTDTDYTVTITDGCSNTFTATTSITVNNTPPSLAINSVTPLCINDENIFLTANVAGGTWSGTGVEGSSNTSGEFNPSLVTLGSTNITYSVNSTCLTAEVNEEIFVNEMTIITLSTNTLTLCPNDAITDLNNLVSEGTGTWSDELGNTDLTSINPSTLTAGNYEYYLASGISNCDDTDTLNVTILAIDDISCSNCSALEIFEENVTPACGQDGGTATLTATGGTGAYTYTWSHDATLNTPSISNVAGGIYTVTVTDETNCSNELTITIDATDLPIVAVMPTDTLCANSNTINLAESDYIITGENGEWLLDNTPITSINPSNYEAQTTLSLVYRVTELDCTNDALFELTIIPLPPISLTQNSVEICKATVLELSTFINTPSSVGQWEGNGVIAGTVFFPEDESITTYNITYNSNETDFCPAVSETLQIQILEPLTISPPSIICDIASYSASITITGGKAPYLVNGELITGNDFTLNDLINPIYEWTVTDSFGCDTLLATINGEDCDVNFCDVINYEINALQDLISTCDTVNGFSIYVEPISTNGLNLSAILNPPLFSTDGIEFTPNDEFPQLALGTHSIYIGYQSGEDTITCLLEEFMVTTPIFNASIQSIYNGVNFTASVTIEGGTPDAEGNYYYEWNNGDETPTISFNENGTISVQITDANDCVVNATYPGATYPTSIKEPDVLNQAINIYPNPTRGQFLIDFNEELAAANINIRIYNILGEEVLLYPQVQGKQLLVDLSSFANGMYLLLFEIDGQQVLRKINKLE